MFFSVVSTQEDAPEPQPYSEDFLPPWAVAVIVIGLASVAFVIVFGVSMVRNIIINYKQDGFDDLSLFQLYKKRKIMQGRGKSGKQALNLTEEMVYEMNRLEHRLTLNICVMISNLLRSGSASGGYSSGLEAAYHNYGNITCSLRV